MTLLICDYCGHSCRYTPHIMSSTVCMICGDKNVRVKTYKDIDYYQTGDDKVQLEDSEWETLPDDYQGGD